MKKEYGSLFRSGVQSTGNLAHNINPAASNNRAIQMVKVIHTKYLLHKKKLC